MICVLIRSELVFSVGECFSLSFFCLLAPKMSAFFVDVVCQNHQILSLTLYVWNLLLLLLLWLLFLLLLSLMLLLLLCELEAVSPNTFLECALCCVAMFEFWPFFGGLFINSFIFLLWILQNKPQRMQLFCHHSWDADCCSYVWAMWYFSFYCWCCWLLIMCVCWSINCICLCDQRSQSLCCIGVSTVLWSLLFSEICWAI